MKKSLSRYPKITVFAFGEAHTERAFLKHIRAVYGRNTGIANIIDCANGGGSDEIVDLAVRRSSGLYYHRKFILFDTDVPWTIKAKNKASENNIELIPATPCIEGFLISLLESTNVSTLSSNECKRRFEKKYLNKEEKLDHQNYEKILPLKVLEDTRKINKILERIIRLMTKMRN